MSETVSITEKARKEANRWVTLLHSEVADSDVADQFETWLNASPENTQAYAEAEQLWRDLKGASAIASFDVDAALADLQHHAPRASLIDRIKARFPKPALIPVGLASGLAAAALAAVIVTQTFDPTVQDQVIAAAPISTEIAEIRDITLADGSVITLGAKSAIREEFTEGARKIVLVEGEAFFDVATDANRPFFVEADDTLIRVVGTQFDVKRSGSRVHVAVLEGIVNVLRVEDVEGGASPTTIDQAPKQVLTAGEKIIVASAAMTNTRLLQVERVETLPGAWREGRLVYENAPLSEVIADANRYHHVPIKIASSSIEDLSVVGSFRTTQIEQMLAGLELSQPVTVDRDRTDRIIIRPARQ